MKFICSKANLVHGVSIVQKAVPQKTTMTILECILIDVSERGIYLLANDMELGIETVIDGEIIEKGVIALDAKIFSEIVRKLPDNDVVMKQMIILKQLLPVKKQSFLFQENQVMNLPDSRILKKMISLRFPNLR